MPEHDPTADVADSPAFESDDTFTPSHVAQEEGYAQLRSAIHRRTREYFEPVGIAAELIPAYADALAEDTERHLKKFADGQLKHGGDIRDRDMIEELRQELSDAGAYVRIELLRRNYIKLEV